MIPHKELSALTERIHELEDAIWQAHRLLDRAGIGRGGDGRLLLTMRLRALVTTLEQAHRLLDRANIDRGDDGERSLVERLEELVQRVLRPEKGD